jgi:hypothetical protein
MEGIKTDKSDAAGSGLSVVIQAIIVTPFFCCCIAPKRGILAAR